MKHLFIPYELALIAKEKGFDEYCFGYFSNINDNHDFCQGHYGSPINETVIVAPLYQQIVDWFFQVHRMEIPYCTTKKVLNKRIEEAFKLI